ncbi:MAG TPA: hypothetical protein VF557_04255 [Jatrophihabitans sp.]|jgi:hypothetical protein|uniref:hypothetical protein n=1 Tax=Jatrophihabitans sp. TaxID=1932789 RepID=UPI002F0EA0BE
MSQTSAGRSDQPVRYEIRVQGRLESRWAAWFDGMSLADEGDGVTNIHGPVADQAALHGLLQRLRDTGLPLLSVTPVASDQLDPPTTGPRSPINPRRRTT